MFNSFLAILLGLGQFQNNQSHSSRRKRRGTRGSGGRRKAPRYRRSFNGWESLERRELLSGDVGYAVDMLAPLNDVRTLAAIVSSPSPTTSPAIEEDMATICGPCLGSQYPVTVEMESIAPAMGHEALEPTIIDHVIVEPPVADPPIIDPIIIELPNLYGNLHPLTQDTLPPPYEAFRQAVGDTELAEWLRQNKQKWGNHQGVCGTGIVDMEQNYPDAYQKFLDTERQLERWLQERSVEPLPGVDQVPPQQDNSILPSDYDSLRQAFGDKELAEYLQRNKQKWGNYQGVCGTGLLEMQQQYPDIYQQFLDTERQLENWLQGQGTLPPMYELFRQALGDNRLAEMLQQNKHRWGNYQGVCGTAIVEMQQHYPEIYQKFLEAERQLEKWMQEQGVLPPTYESLRQALGDKGLADMLRDNKKKWGNYQGICGTAILEMQQNYPKIYQQFLETERQLDKWLFGQSSGRLPGDHNFDGTVNLAEYAVCQASQGNVPYYYDGLDGIVLVVQDEGKNPLQDAIDKATELKEGLDNAKLIAKVTEVLKQAAKHANSETPDPINALRLVGEAIGLMKELAPVGMAEMLDAYAKAIDSIASALDKIALTLYDKAIDKAYSETGDPKQAAAAADALLPETSAEDRARGIKRVTLRHLKTTHVPAKSFWDWKWFPWNWSSMLPGDYNTDGIVNVADHAVWRAAYGTSVTPFSGADGTGDGVVDPADYVVWRKNVGNTAAAGLHVSITGQFPPPITDALRIMLVVQAWKDDSIEIREAATQYAVEILRRERARIERQVENELGPLAWAVFDIEQPSQGELRQRALESESPVYILLREAANNHADSEVRGRAQGVLNTVHPIEPALPDGVFELPPLPPGPVVPPPVPAPVEDVALLTGDHDLQEKSLRFYELRIVTFDSNGSEVESVENRLDLPSAPVDPAELPALFGRLPADRYRIYLIEDGAERLILDFIIQQAQPVETPEAVDEVEGVPPDGGIAPPAVDGAEQLAFQDASAVTALQTEIVPLELVGGQTLVQDKSTPAKLGIIEEWQLVISDGKVTSITKNGQPHDGALPANVANDVKPILDQLKPGMVGSILVRYYEVLGSDGKRLSADCELKETITPAAGVTTGGTKVKAGVVSTPDRLFHIDYDKNFKDKTLLQLIEVSGHVVAYHKITITKNGVTVQVLSKKEYDEELKKL